MAQTTVNKPSMNEANERDPFNNNSYGTLVDTPYKLVNLPVLDVIDFNERIIRGYEEGCGEKELPADLSLARSLVPAGTATLARLQQHLPGDPRLHPRELHRLHGLRHRVPRHRHPRQGALRDRAGREAREYRQPRSRPRDVPPAVVQDQEVLRRGQEEGRCRRHVQHHHRPQQVQGLRRVRHGLR